MSPHRHSLSKRTRTMIFIGLVVVFFVATPLVWLYASGYRLVSFDIATSTAPLVQTGGLFIGTTNTTLIFVDDSAERGSRLFARARYIDGVTAGEHRIVVQEEGKHAWVKKLSVDAQFVTEAYAFNVPATTSVRVITEYENKNGLGVMKASSTIRANIVNKYVVDKSRKNVAYKTNTRFSELVELFSASSSIRQASVSSRIASMRSSINAIDGSNTASSSDEIVMVSRGGIDIVRNGDEVVARYGGSITKVPYYFCAREEREEQRSSNGEKSCDPSIIIDRQNKIVRDVSFYPSTLFNALIMTRDDGVFITEIDNRGGWQNTQPIVVGEGFQAKVIGNTIYLYDGEVIYEVVNEE